MKLSLRSWSSVSSVLVIGAAVASASAAQSPPAARPAFEAASVKPNTSSSPLRTSTFFQRGGQLSITNHALRLLMAMAFRFDVNQMGARIVGLPRWGDTDPFDIQAAVPGNPSTEEKRSMLQALLADRFKLTVHRETRQLPVFGLVLASPGRPAAQLRPATDEATCEQRPLAAPPSAPAARTATDAAALALRDVPCGRITGGILGDDRSQAWAGGRRVSLAMFAGSLGELTPLERPVVIDRTGLDGLFDVTMVWNPQIQELSSNAADAPGLSFLQALREYLGLRLQPESGPVEVLVVDRVERPAPD